MRRYELQLWEPDKGGWRTVLTAVDPAMLRISARTLAWQTQKPLRVVGPDGVVADTVDEVELPPGAVVGPTAGPGQSAVVGQSAAPAIGG